METCYCYSSHVAAYTGVRHAFLQWPCLLTYGIDIQSLASYGFDSYACKKSMSEASDSKDAVETDSRTSYSLLLCSLAQCLHFTSSCTTGCTMYNSRSVLLTNWRAYFRYQCNKIISNICSLQDALISEIIFIGCCCIVCYIHVLFASSSFICIRLR